VFLTKKISQFLFLAVEDILVLYLPIQDEKKNHALFPGEHSIKQTLTGKEVEKKSYTVKGARLLNC
jgi:hypothetical protein